MKKITFFIFVLLFFVLNNVFPQDTIVIQTGPEGKDAYINDYYTTNYGDYPNMFALATTSWGDPFTSRSLLEFDLSSIPPGAYVLEAKLSLYFANNPSNPHYHCGENAAFLQRVIEPWDEHEVTWWNQPGITEQNQVTLRTSHYGTEDYPDIDVKDLFQDIISDPENSHGILFRLQVEGFDRKMMFASGDYMDNPELRPKLEIIYISCEPPTVDYEYQVDGDTVSFAGISPSATSWHWDFGDGDTSDIQNPEHVYLEQGNFQVCLRVEDTCYFAEHCEIVDLCYVPTPVSGFTYMIDGLMVTFQDTSIMADEYYWDFGDGYYSNLINPFHIYDLPGQYEVCLMTWNDCGSDTACEMVDLCMPVSAFDYEIEGLNVYFHNESMLADDYYWDFGDGYFSDLSNPWHAYELNLNYLVCLITRNECGSDTTCEMLDLTAVSIPDYTSDSFSIYPNPANDMVFIKAATDGIVRLSLLGLSGKEVLSQNMDVRADEIVKISLEQVEPGIYIMRLDSEKSMAYGKLVVMK